MDLGQLSVQIKPVKKGELLMCENCGRKTPYLFTIEEDFPVSYRHCPKDMTPEEKELVKALYE